ncbi:hypothetical protein V2G26_012140 [Clonostachys chloroleuca]
MGGQADEQGGQMVQVSMRAGILQLPLQLTCGTGFETAIPSQSSHELQTATSGSIDSLPHSGDPAATPALATCKGTKGHVLLAWHRPPSFLRLPARITVGWLPLAAACVINSKINGVSTPPVSYDAGRPLGLVSCDSMREQMVEWSRKQAAHFGTEGTVW